MNIDDFRYMRRGRQISAIDTNELALLKAIDQRGPGSDKALLILHGFSSTPAVFREFIPKIKHYDAIVCPVLAGHGVSIDAFSKAKASNWLETAVHSCENLLSTFQQVDVLGLSLGGLLACELSTMFPLHHLYLLAPALKLHIKVNAMLHLAQALHYLGFRHFRNRAGDLLSNEHAEIAYRKLPITTIIEMLHYQLNFKWQAPICPTDLFLGTHDAVVASGAVAKLFTDLPNAHIHWLDNSAHILPLDNDMNEIITCINKK